MRMSTSRLAGSLAVAACLSLSLVETRIAHAADPAAAAGTAKPAGNKPLHTVPEDGSGSEDMSASSRIVREVVAAHPNEDLVICIAGCRPGIDRVIYAQPADPMAKAAAVAVTQEPSVEQPAVAQDAPAAPTVVNATPETPAVQSEAAAPDVQPAAPDAKQAAKPETPSDGEARMEPTAAQDAEAPEASAGEAAAESSSNDSDASAADESSSEERPSEPPSGE